MKASAGWMRWESDDGYCRMIAINAVRAYDLEKVLWDELIEYPIGNMVSMEE